MALLEVKGRRVKPHLGQTQTLTAKQGLSWLTIIVPIDIDGILGFFLFLKFDFFILQQGSTLTVAN